MAAKWHYFYEIQPATHPPTYLYKSQNTALIPHYEMKFNKQHQIRKVCLTIRNLFPWLTGGPKMADGKKLADVISEQSLILSNQDGYIQFLDGYIGRISSFRGYLSPAQIELS